MADDTIQSLVEDATVTAETLGRLAEDETVFRLLIQSFRAQDHEGFRALLGRFRLLQHCELVCAWITAKLRDDPKVLASFVEAVAREDADANVELIKTQGLERYCHRLCFWLSRLICRRFCWCVCPPPRPRPWFTHVGHFHIYGDIDAGSGLTNKAVLGHGGPGYGFFGCMELRGFCPAVSPDAAGVPMRYRFLIERNGTRTPLIGNLLCTVNVGSRTIFWDVNGTGLEETFQTVRIAGSGATLDPTPPPAVPRGTPWGPASTVP